MKRICCKCGMENDMGYECVACGSWNTGDYVCSECGALNDPDETCKRCGHECCENCEASEELIELVDEEYLFDDPFMDQKDEEETIPW